ncbi:MAG: alpha/beta fold hydrolase [Pseudomonadota bacterium]
MATNPAAIEAPSPLLALTELPRALFELGSLPFAAGWLASAPRGDGHSVMVLPGFLTTDRSTGLLRRYLRGLGYNAHAWELGRNLGPRAVGMEGEKLIARLRAIHDINGEKVSLVGWSLGGVLARLVAGRAPDAVRQVISLGSPFTGDPRASNVSRTYQFVTGQKFDKNHTRGQLREVSQTPPVPTTAIYSKGDGVVAWQNCMDVPGPQTENIEVRGSHCGLGVNASVLYAIADRLAQPAGDWHKFERDGVKAMIYPAGNA